MISQKDFVIKIGFDVDKKNQSDATKSIESLKAGFSNINKAVMAAEAAAKKSLGDVSTSFKQVDKAVESAKDETKQFVEAVDKAKDETTKDVKETEESFGALGEVIGRVKGLLLTLAAGFTLDSIIGNITNTANKFEQLGNLAKELGTKDVDNLASMQYVFGQLGVEVDTLNDGLKNMTDYIGQARLGEGEGLEVFKALKIDVTSDVGKTKDTVEIFNELTEKLNTLDHATQVAYINMLGLDTELIKGMSASRDEVEKLKRSFEQTYTQAGVNINDVAERATKFNQSMRALQGVIQAIKDALGAKFLDLGTKTFDRLRVIATENMGKIIDTLSKLLDVIFSVFDALGGLVKMFIDMIGAAIDWWKNADSGFKTVAKAVAAITAAILILNSAFLKSPIGRFIAALSLIAALVQDFQMWRDGTGKTLLGSFLGDYDDFIAKIDGASNELGIFAGVIKWAIEHADLLMGALLTLPIGFKLVKGVASGLGTVISVIIGLFSSLGSIFKFVKGVAAVLAVAFKPLISLFGGLVRLIPFLIAGLIKLGAAFFALPITWVIAIIAAVIGAIWLIWDNWDIISQYLVKAWEWVKNSFGAGLEYIWGLIKTFFSWVGSIAGAILEPFKKLWSYIGGLYDKLKSFGSKALKFIGIDLGEAPAAPSLEGSDKAKEIQASKDLAAVNSSLADSNTALTDLNNGLSESVDNSTSQFNSLNTGLSAVQTNLDSLNTSLAAANSTVQNARDLVSSTAAIANDARTYISSSSSNNSMVNSGNVNYNFTVGSNEQAMSLHNQTMSARSNQAALRAASVRAR